MTWFNYAVRDAQVLTAKLGQKCV